MLCASLRVKVVPVLVGNGSNADKVADDSSRHFLGEEISFVFIGCD